MGKKFRENQRTLRFLHQTDTAAVRSARQAQLRAAEGYQLPRNCFAVIWSHVKVSFMWQSTYAKFVSLNSMKVGFTQFGQTITFIMYFLMMPASKLKNRYSDKKALPNTVTGISSQRSENIRTLVEAKDHLLRGAKRSPRIGKQNAKE